MRGGGGGREKKRLATVHKVVVVQVIYTWLKVNNQLLQQDVSAHNLAFSRMHPHELKLLDLLSKLTIDAQAQRIYSSMHMHTYVLGQSEFLQSLQGLHQQVC